MPTCMRPKRPELSTAAAKGRSRARVIRPCSSSPRKATWVRDRVRARAKVRVRVQVRARAQIRVRVRAR